jgi:putative redox protein
VRNLGRALLVFHSPTDAIVGIENARMIYDSARHPKSFVSLDGADHLLTDPTDAAYVASIAAVWAARYVDENAWTQRSPTSGLDDAVPTTSGYQVPGARATTRKGLATEIATRGFLMRADEPAADGGTETGPTPYDLLAAALATCTSMTLRIYANHKGMSLDEVSVQVTHTSVHAEDCRNCENKEGKIALLERTIEIIGDLSETDREKLMKIADRCPVHRTLHGSIEVHTSRSTP